MHRDGQGRLGRQVVRIRTAGAVSGSCARGSCVRLFIPGGANSVSWAEMCFCHCEVNTLGLEEGDLAP
jgi:hypothetical protein